MVHSTYFIYLISYLSQMFRLLKEDEICEDSFDIFVLTVFLFLFLTQKNNVADVSQVTLSH